MQNTDKWLSLTKPGEMLQTVFLKSLCCYRRVVENSFPKLWPKKGRITVCYLLSIMNQPIFPPVVCPTSTVKETFVWHIQMSVQSG